MPSTLPDIGGLNGGSTLRSYLESVAQSFKTAQGSSSSGTPGTNVANLVADAGFQLVDVNVVASQANAANTQFTVTVTYSDATNTSVASVAATANTVIGNSGGLILTAAGALSSLTANSAKPITQIQVTTLGAGVGARSATLAATQIPL